MSTADVSLLEEAKEKHAESVARLDELNARIKALPDDAATDEVEFLRASFKKEEETAKRWAEAVDRTQIIMDARTAVKPQPADDPEAKPQRVEVKEPLTYRKNGPHRFFLDQLRVQKGDPEAAERLKRHMLEMRVEIGDKIDAERRDITTTAGAGGEFVPPLWLTNQWVELLRAARPTADAVQSFPLPPGTNSINLPKLSGGGATAVQSSENSGVQETDPTTTSVTAAVQTIAGQIDMSRQLFEFSNPGMDEILFRDLARDYATKLDIAVLSGAVTNAKGLRNVASINTVTYTDSTPTPAEAWPKITDAIQRITSAFLNPDTIVMHPRRAAFFLAATDTTGRPLFNAGAPQNAMGEISGTVANGFAGGLQGMRVVIDPNIPTNVGTNTREDVIIVFDSNQVYLWEEGAPRSRVFEDVGSGTLTVRLSVYGFYAFMAGRYPSGISVITGTGFDPPTF